MGMNNIWLKTLDNGFYFEIRLYVVVVIQGPLHFRNQKGMHSYMPKDEVGRIFAVFFLTAYQQ
jgi:hypothetical protein